MSADPERNNQKKQLNEMKIFLLVIEVIFFHFEGVNVKQ